jgi:hypothetical protein
LYSYIQVLLLHTVADRASFRIDNDKIGVVLNVTMKIKKLSAIIKKPLRLHQGWGTHTLFYISPGRAVVVETDEHDFHGLDLTQVAVDLRTRKNLDGKLHKGCSAHHPENETRCGVTNVDRRIP